MSFDIHRRRLNDQAKSAMKDWVSTLPPSKRREIESGGLDHINDSNEVGGHSPFAATDIADSPAASYEPDISGIDKDFEIFAEQFGVTEDTAKAILKWHSEETEKFTRKQEALFLGLIVGGLLATDNPKLSAAGLAFAVGLEALNGLGSIREFAKSNHISPTAVSKVSQYWRRTLNLPTSAFQKSDKARNIYSKVGKENHWRNRTVTTATATALLAKIKKPANQTSN